MMRANGSYGAPGWLPGGHAQTIYPALIRRPQVAYRRQRVDTPDGDFIDLDWLETYEPEDNAPLVVLFHGLEGNSRSHYAVALMAHLRSIGWRGVVPHFRGCSGELNRRPRAYHSGDYTEVAWMLETIRALEPGTPLFPVGVSLGGSALLNWLGREEHRAASIVAAAAAVSAPLDLTAAGIAIEQGMNRIYSRHFRATLVPKAMAMARTFPGTLDAAAIASARLRRHGRLLAAGQQQALAQGGGGAHARAQRPQRSVHSGKLASHARRNQYRDNARATQ